MNSEKHSKTPPNNTKEYYEYWTNKGLSVYDLAKMENVTQGCISKRLKKYNVQPSQRKIKTILNVESFVSEIPQSFKSESLKNKSENNPIPKESLDGITNITEEYLEQYLLKLSYKDFSPQVAKLMMDFLDKKKALTKVDEYGINQNDIEGLREILNVEE